MSLHWDAMRLLSVMAMAMALLAASSIVGWAAAEDIPLPRPRPASLAERFPNAGAPGRSHGSGERAGARA
jgi:hypothetical protein